MAESKKGILSKTIGVSGATLLSRILGLLRVRLEAEILGGGAYASAWFLAFAIPNLFRRLFGEGALGQALVPMLAETETKYGAKRARHELGVIFPALGLLLALLVVLCSGAALLGARLIPHSPVNLRYVLALRLIPLLMPYAFFICLVGAIGAVLNYLRVFVLPALGALLLNIFLVGGLFWGYYRQLEGTAEPLESFLALQGSLVLFSGFFQLLLMVLLLKHQGRMPIFSRIREHIGVLKKLFFLALPGFIGGAAIQLSFLIDRGLALLLHDQAVPALTYIDRIIDLPIGIFAVSMGQVMMVRMSRSAASGDMESLNDELNYALRHLLFWCVPMAFGVIFFQELLLRVICLGGKYSASDMGAAFGVAVFYGAAIPFFCSAKVLLPAFYARKSMKKPLYCSLAAIALNIIFNLLLMIPFQQTGIAMATLISTVTQNTLLVILLTREGVALQWGKIWSSAWRALLFSFTGCGGIFFWLQRLPDPESRLSAILYLGLAGGGFAVFYLLCGKLFRAREIRELFHSGKM